MSAPEGEEWYLKGLLAFMLGIGADNVSALAHDYLDQGGEKDPGSLFRFLASQGRHYRVLWALFPFSEQISLVSVSVFGPGGKPLWRNEAALPYGSFGPTLTSWKRVLPLVSGILAASQPQVSESDLWVAGQMVRHLRLVWTQHEADLLREIEMRKEEGETSFQGDRDFFRDLPFDLEKALREATGKNIPARAVFLSETSLPELRDVAGDLSSLQKALDDFVKETVSPDDSGNKTVTESSDPPKRPGLQDYQLRVDPIKGVPLSELSPGTLVLLEGDSSTAAVGKLYMIRLMKNGQIEVHGSLVEAEGTFFRSVAPGDIKVAVAKDNSLPPLFQAPLLLFAGGLILLVLLLLLFLR